MCDLEGKWCLRLFTSLEKSNLRTLIFDCNDLTTTAPKVLASAVGHMARVSTLSLNSCKLGNEGAAGIAQADIMYRQQLHVLSLQNNRISVFFPARFPH